jgi:hypothetical protein
VHDVDGGMKETDGGHYRFPRTCDMVQLIFIEVRRNAKVYGSLLAFQQLPIHFLVNVSMASTI